MPDKGKCDIVKNVVGRFYCQAHQEMVEAYSKVSAGFEPEGTSNPMVPIYRCRVGGEVGIAHLL